MDEFQIDILIDVLPLDDIQGRRGANLPSIWMLSIPYELQVREVEVRLNEAPL